MYSQSNEDKKIVEYFKGRGPMNLLDIGANDGRTFSNSLKLIQSGWNAVLIEPSTLAFERLKKTHSNNPRAYLFNYAISDYDGECDFYESGPILSPRLMGKDVALISTIDEKELGRWQKWKGQITFEKKTVPCKTFESFYKESPLKQFQFITIDTEGYDWKILAQMDLAKLGCEMLCVEYIGDGSKHIKTILDLGYCERIRTRENMLVVKHKKAEITSHTIVKNGMPFIAPVLKQVSPFMTKMLVTISRKSNDGTEKAIRALNDPKIEIDYEDVDDLGDLTKERQKQVDKTTTEWILFLDDDDFWTYRDLDRCIHRLDDGVDGLAVNPYQVLDSSCYDGGFWNKFFTKFFRNGQINYRGRWPMDLIYKGNDFLYWKTNPKVPKVNSRFYHLALVKPYSFRNDKLKEYKYKMGKRIEFDRPLPNELRRLL